MARQTREGRRVEFIANSLVVGGAERVVESLCLRLPSLGWKVGLTTLREPGPIGESLAAANVELHSALAPRRADPLQIFTLRRHLSRVGADAVYVLDHSNALFYGRAAARWLGRVQVCAVHRTGRSDGSSSLSRMDRFLMRWSQRVVAVSETHREYLAREEGVEQSKLVAIPNGIDVERFDPARAVQDRGALRRGLGLPVDRRLVGVVAALRPEKNHELLLRAVAGEDRLSDCDLVFVGDGPRRGQLEAMVKTTGMSDRVHWLGRLDDVVPVLWALDALALPSHPKVETFPLCILEAMAARTPVVATDVGSLREMLGPEGTGALVPPGDIAGLRDALAAVLDDAEATKRRCELAWTRVRREYGVEKMVERTSALLAELLDG